MRGIRLEEGAERKLHSTFIYSEKSINCFHVNFMGKDDPETPTEIH